MLCGRNRQETQTVASDQGPPLILASGSPTRAAMLRAVGLPFSAVPADVDEAALYQNAISENPQISPDAVAALLARAKAENVSRSHPEALVIGGDQVLAVGKDLVFKAADGKAARAILLRLKGQTHTLHSAVSLAASGVESWSAADTATLTMRDFSSAFLDDYIARAGDALTSSAGCYQIEGLGLTLFEKVSGNHATILGLPLLALLAELRARGVVMP